MYKYAPNTRKRLVGKICALVGVIAIIATLFVLPTSADNANTHNATILYNPIYDSASGQASWTFDTTSIDYTYTDSVIYLVYSASSVSGVWSVSSGGESYTIQWDDFSVGQGYKVAMTYLDNQTLTDMLVLTRSMFFGTDTTQILYLVIGDESNEQDIGYLASILCDLENDGYTYITDYLLYTLSSTDTYLVDQAINQGILIGRQDGYDHGYTEGYNIGFTYGESNGYNEGRDNGFTQGYNQGKEVGYFEGYNDGADGIGLERLPFAITDSIADMFTRILNFELLGVNVLALCGTFITLAIVAFVIKRLI